MAQNYLAIALNSRTNRIGLRPVVRFDIAPWVASAILSLLLFVGVSALVTSANPNLNEGDAVANLYTWARPFYFALVVLAVLSARRSKDVWTWVLSVILIVFFIPQGATTIANMLLPNSILPALTAMVGFLAAGRIIEYVHMRYMTKLSEPTLSFGALTGYVLLILGAIFTLETLTTAQRLSAPRAVTHLK